MIYDDVNPVKFFPLYDAARKGDINTLKILLTGREDEINSYDANHFYGVLDTILWNAASYGHISVVKYMVELGADSTTRNNYAFSNAALGNHIDVVRYIFSVTEIDYEDIHTAVCNAARKGHTDMIKTLASLTDGIIYLMVNGESIYTTAIYWASCTDRFETIKYLISMGQPTTFLTTTQKLYILFCEKMQEKKRVKAQKKIYFWWIQICYDLSHPSGCGQRMAQKNLDVFETVMKV